MIKARHILFYCSNKAHDWVKIHHETTLNRFLPLIVAVIVSMTATRTYAEDTYINAAETLAFGVFSSKEIRKLAKAATKDAPPVDSVSQYRFQDFTNQIPMVLGTEFGIEYQINTKPKGRPIDITTIIRFPKPGLVQPKGKTYLESKETKRIRIGQPHLHGYGFDEEWELVAGEWVFEVWHKKAKLVSKTFTVYEPGSAQSAANSD